MLIEKEREGCLKFLEGFQNHELLSLVETVTNHMIIVHNKQEAINAILLHSKSAKELLKRRKIKKEYIFRHLATENIGGSPTADKETLVRQLLSHWGTTVSEPHEPHHLDEMEEDSIQKGDCNDQRLHCSRHSSTGGTTIDMQALAEHFASWFYQQLNSLNRVEAEPPASEWGPQHFWEDAKLNLYITSSERREEIFQGAELVAQRFESFVREEGLIFNPNIGREGTRGLEELHGLVVVRVCGTVHRTNECLGVFEQQFGLVRDPMRENNWKIKFVDMNLKQQKVQQMQTLKAPPDMSLAII